jgi:hypothetical protein
MRCCGLRLPTKLLVRTCSRVLRARGSVAPAKACKIRTMKRWMMIFLLFLLPLQFSWAAVASYCQHESEVTANHPGHHSHDHQAADQHESSKDGVSSAEVHHDCATCHLGCSAALASDLTMPGAATDRDHPFDYRFNPSRALIERPERPQWPALA